MSKRIPLILAILMLSAVTMAQGKLKENLVADSLILKLKISKVIEHSYNGSDTVKPSWSRINIFDTVGRIIHDTSINYYFHKLVSDYTYNKKKNRITRNMNFYDWNPRRKDRPGDTIITKEVEKYHLDTKIDVEWRDPFSKFKKRYVYDSLGRVSRIIDTIKCGNKITSYFYDEKGRVVMEENYRTHHHDQPKLQFKEHFNYTEGGRLSEILRYSDFKDNGTKTEPGHESIIIYFYNAMGLVETKIEITRYLTLRTSYTNTHKYFYEFY